MGVLLGATAVSVNCGGFGVLEGLGVFEGLGVSVGKGVTMPVVVGTGVSVLVGRRVGAMVGMGVNVLVGVGVNPNVRVGLGNKVGVRVEVIDGLLPSAIVAVAKKMIDREVGVTERVGVGDPDDATMEVIVTVGVKLGTRVSPPLMGIIREDVGVKKRSAKASCVRARSRGVAVAVCLGRRMISS
jgi:hypothetical protein